VCVIAENEATRLREEATLPIEELLERYGGAGLLVNQALANMKKGGKVLSPVVRAKPSLTAEDESEGSTSESQDPAAEGVDSSGSEPPRLSEKDDICVSLADSISNGFCKEDDDVAKTSSETVAKNDSSPSVDPADGAPSSSLQANGTTSAAECDSGKAECSSAGDEVHSDAVGSHTSDAADSTEAGESCADDEPGPSCSTAEVP